MKKLLALFILFSSACHSSATPLTPEENRELVANIKNFPVRIVDYPREFFTERLIKSFAYYFLLPLGCAGLMIKKSELITGIHCNSDNLTPEMRTHFNQEMIKGLSLGIIAATVGSFIEWIQSYSSLLASGIDLRLLDLISEFGCYDKEGIEEAFEDLYIAEYFPKQKALDDLQALQNHLSFCIDFFTAIQQKKSYCPTSIEPILEPLITNEHFIGIVIQTLTAKELLS